MFALAEVAFWTLCGRHPYAGAGVAALLMAKGRGPCQSLQHLRPDLPVAIDDVLRKGMAPEPEDRFQSPGEFAELLAASVIS